MVVEMKSMLYLVYLRIVNELLLKKDRKCAEIITIKWIIKVFLILVMIINFLLHNYNCIIIQFHGKLFEWKINLKYYENITIMKNKLYC